MRGGGDLWGRDFVGKAVKNGEEYVTETDSVVVSGSVRSTIVTVHGHSLAYVVVCLCICVCGLLLLFCCGVLGGILNDLHYLQFS